MSKLGIARSTAVVELVTNLELLADHTAAESELERLNKLTPAADRLNNPYSQAIRDQAARVIEIEEQMQSSIVCVKLRALKRAQYAELVEKHPAREGNDVDKAFGLNTDTFGEEIMPLSIVEAYEKVSGDKVEFSGDDWAEESAELSNSQYSDFISAVLRINNGSVDVPFSLIASRVTRS